MKNILALIFVLSMILFSSMVIAENDLSMKNKLWDIIQHQAPNDVKSLISKADVQDGLCRGGAGNEQKTMEACSRRDKFLNKLELKGWCHSDGSGDQFGYEMRWQWCNVVVKILK